MGRDYMRIPDTRRVFEEADDILGWSLSRLCSDGSAQELKRTDRVQPAMLTVCVAALRLLEQETGLRPRACLGHSLGEYTALVAAGSLDFKDALQCVQRRGEFMDAVLPPRTGGMAAVLGLGRSRVESVCAEVADGMVTVANLNAPEQVVISGHRKAVARCTPGLEEAGARRVIELEVSSAFHSPLMSPAAERLREVLEQIPVDPPRCPVLSNVTARPHQDPRSIRTRLVEQVTSPVRWADCVRWVLDSGVRDFIEVGPGGVLAGLNRAIDRSARTEAVEKVTRSNGQEKAS
jgi:[acyl-carrier-protein] S-malonyltransferase